MEPAVDRDITEVEFASRVIWRSSTLPVVVDFWAPWCQPCRILSPTLDRLERAANGAWELVKVDIDREPALASRYRITSIPALMGFRDGQRVSEMLGAQPEPEIRAFLTRLLPSEVDRLVSEATAALQGGDSAQAEQQLRKALAAEPVNTRALLALGSVLLDDSRLNEAAEFLEQVPPLTEEGRSARALLARLRFSRHAVAESADGQSGTMSPEDARWTEGNRAAANGDFRAALNHFLWLVESNRQYRDDCGRRAVLSVFDILGPDHPLTLEFRSQLSSLLF
jgi:putative thioredoxin